jgi:hypothetical protein
MRKIRIGSDYSGVGAYNHNLERCGIDYEEVFACDFNLYARISFLSTFGTKEDLQRANGREHKKFALGVEKICLGESKLNPEEQIQFLRAANDYAKKFSFYYPFNVYDREIPEEPLDEYMTSPPCQAFSLAGKREGKNIRSLGIINNNLLNTWADACSVLLDFRKHKTPVSFEIDGHIKAQSQLKWESIENKTGYEDLEQTAEFAGYGMGLLLVNTFEGLVPVSRRAKGDGVDIVCSKEVEESDNFLQPASESFYIEAKGTRNKSAVKPQLNAGIKQSAKAPGNVHVISTEFETPSALTHFRK